MKDFIFVVGFCGYEENEPLGFFCTEEEARAFYDQIPTDRPSDDPNLRRYIWWEREGKWSSMVGISFYIKQFPIGKSFSRTEEIELCSKNLRQ
jgi:hypothetical protein